MRTIEKTVYLYDELPTEFGKAKAREWYRETGLDFEWWDGVYDEAKEILSAIGFSGVDIQFTGFSQQGDGASFTGRYGAAAGWREAAAGTEVFVIAESLDAMQARYDGRLTAAVERDRYGYSRYCHEGTMAVSLYEEGGDGDVPEAHEAEFLELARRLARWIYERLEAEWDYLNGDESIADVMRWNDYEFYADGSRCRE
jgi:hypothetical protein